MLADLSVTSSHLLFSGCGRSAPRKLGYLQIWILGERMKRLHFAVCLCACAALSSQSETCQSKTSGWSKGTISERDCWRVLTLSLASACPEARTRANTSMNSRPCQRTAVRRHTLCPLYKLAIMWLLSMDWWLEMIIIIINRIYNDWTMAAHLL